MLSEIVSQLLKIAFEVRNALNPIYLFIPHTLFKGSLPAELFEVRLRAETSNFKSGSFLSSTLRLQLRTLALKAGCASASPTTGWATLIH